MKNVLKMAEALCNRVDEDIKLNKEYFFMFSVCKFILLKESMIKKDSKSHVIYFDNVKNIKYVPIIMKLYNYIINNGEVIFKESDKISLDFDDDLDKLKKAVWVINKLRDSLAHGAYNFDFINNCICVDNSSTDNDNMYLLRCNIPISLLNSFSLVNKERTDFYIDDDMVNRIKLIDIENMIYSDKIKDKRVLDKIYRLLGDYNQNFDDGRGSELLEEVNKLLGINNKDNLDYIACLYNYLLLTFSKFDVNKYDYRYVKTSDFSFVFKDNFDDVKNKILNRTNGFISNMNNIITYYYKSGEEKRKLRMVNMFNDFFLSILDVFDDKNRFIVTSIRNGVCHGNFEECEGYVGISDKLNNNDPKSIKFDFISKPYDLFLLAKSLNSKDAIYNVGDFFNEIRACLDNDIYNSLFSICNNMFNILFNQDIDLNMSLGDLYRYMIPNVKKGIK